MMTPCFAIRRRRKKETTRRRNCPAMEETQLEEGGFNEYDSSFYIDNHYPEDSHVNVSTQAMMSPSSIAHKHNEDHAR